MQPQCWNRWNVALDSMVLSIFFNYHLFCHNISFFQIGDGNCLGRIDNAAKLVTWINYQTVMKRITNFGNGLYHILDGAKIRNQTNGMFPCIGIYSKNCPEYVIAEYGCYWQSLVVVPIYDTLGPHACSFISNQGENFSIERFIQKKYTLD